MGRTAPLTSKRCILYIYSTNIGTEYFKHALYSPLFFSLQNAVCFIMLTCLVPVLFTFYIQDVLKLKKKIIPAPKRLIPLYYSFQPVACRYTDYATRPTIREKSGPQIVAFDLFTRIWTRASWGKYSWGTKICIYIYLYSRLYDVSTSSCAHLTIILSSSSICLCHSSLLPLIPFPPSVL